MATLSDRGELTGARPLGERLYGDLVWSRPGIFSREWRLEAGSELLAVLRWERVLSFEAVAETGDGRWTIGRHRRGSLLGQVVVRDARTQAVVATHTSSWRETGAARFASGAEFKWVREGFWRPTHFWSTPDRPQLIGFKTLMSWKRSVEMHVDPAAHGLAELPVLVLLGAYLMAMAAARSHAH